jgi:ribosomal protein L30
VAAKLRVTLVKSVVSHTARTRSTVRALGLYRIGQTVEVADTPTMRGMTRAVRFLLTTEQVAAAAEPTPAQQPTAAKAPAAKAPAAKAPAKAKAAKPTTAMAAKATTRTAATAKAPARARAKKEESQP